MDDREPKMSGTLRERTRLSKNQSDRSSSKNKQFKLNFIIKSSLGLISFIGISYAGFYGFTHRHELELSSSFDCVNLGFKCEHIKIEGVKYANKDDIKKAISTKIGSSIFLESPEEIRETIEKISWVRTAVVRRKLPNTLSIRVVEYQPIAYWQVDQHLFLIDSHGVIIQAERHRNLTHLPVITGEKAAEKFPQLIKEIEDFPDIYNRITGAVFISKRRWDIILDAKVKIKLPEQNIKSAMQYLYKLEGDHSLSNKDISSIDLRIPDRAFFTLSENARMMKFYNSKDKQA